LTDSSAHTSRLSQGSDWLGDQDAIEFMCREAVPVDPELEHLGVPFTRSDNGQIYQRAFGGQTVRYGEALHSELLQPRTGQGRRSCMPFTSNV
jgi:succinate dehydrogenase/fumarate reductase flavoprotein subunit